MDLRFFGGRGSGRGGGGGQMAFSNSRFSNGMGTKVPDTLKEALGEKGKPKTIGDATVGTNPNFSTDYREYSANCQRCVIAYEARRRGYDVEAQPTYRGDTLNQVAYYDNTGNLARGRWMGAFQGAKPKNVSATTEKGVMDNIDSKMAQYGDGSRGVIQIFYKGGGGHVFNVERQNGRTVYIEAQAGRIKNFERTLRSVDTSLVSLTRTDNLRFSGRARQFITPAK